MMKTVFALLTVPLVAVNLWASDESRSGAELYQTCSACHLPGGEGIPGAFPPLKNRLADIASSDAGRSYLIMVIKSGLMGPIDVDGTRFQGVMPAQLLQNEEIAKVLNYVTRELGQAPDGWQSFTAEEVASSADRHAGSNGYAVAELRRQL